MKSFQLTEVIAIYMCEIAMPERDLKLQNSSGLSTPDTIPTYIFGFCVKPQRILAFEFHRALRNFTNR